MATRPIASSSASARLHFKPNPGGKLMRLHTRQTYSTSVLSTASSRSTAQCRRQHPRFIDLRFASTGSNTSNTRRYKKPEKNANNPDVKRAQEAYTRMNLAQLGKMSSAAASINEFAERAELGDSEKEDRGLLPGTIILPTGARKPSLFSRERLSLEWQRLTKWPLDFISLLVFKFSFKPRVKLQSRKISSTALDLYRQMYTAIAEGDTRVINQITTSGIRNQLQSRIAQRTPGTSCIWTLHSSKKPKLVSDRAAMIPLPDGLSRKSALRQAVVRIRSRQSLQVLDKNGQEVEGTGKVKDIVEYFVLQKASWRGEHGSWRIWGMTNEQSMAEIRKAKAVARYGEDAGAVAS